MNNSALHTLARRIEGANALALAAHSETAKELFPELGAASFSVAGGVASFVGAELPISYAVGLGMREPVTSEDIRRLIEFYESRGTVPRVDVCPLADASLIGMLREHGFHLYSFMNVLARTLETYDLIAPLPVGVSVRQAEAKEADLWTRTVDEGFANGGPLTDARQQLGMILFYRPGLRAYFAEIEGEIAGGGALFVHDGYAGLVASSVRPAFRNRRVHTALIRARLMAALELNCDAAGIFAEPGSTSQRNAERHGLRVLYTKAVMKKG